MSYSQRKMKYWRGILAEYESSELKTVEFCRRNHLDERSFYRWRKRLSCELPEDRRSDLSGLQLVPVGSLSSPPIDRGPESGVSVDAGGLRIHLACGFDVETLHRVLEIAGGLPC